MKYDALKSPDPAEWLEADEDERTLACASYHRRLKDDHPRAKSRRLHDSFHVIVENQLALGEPPQARAALQRLLAEGLDRHEAIHAIGSQIAGTMWELMSTSTPFNEKEYASKLQALTAESWRREYASEEESDEPEEGEWADDEELEADLLDGEDEEDDDSLLEAEDDAFLPEPETFRRDSPKAAPNDRCPCGSGKKYKRCCQDQDSRPESAARNDGLAPVIALSDRRIMERSFADPSGGLGSKAGRKRDPVAEAQQVMYDAWEASNPGKRVALARQALDISPDCADAYVLLAEEEATTPEQAVDSYSKAVAAAERVLGLKPFEEDVGLFWGLLETRPYMRARHGLAQALWEAGKRDEALGHYRELLRLNPNDNQGVRYQLLGSLIESAKDDEAGKLLKKYEEDASAAWAYSAALLAFRKQGDCEPSKKALSAAVEANPHVPAFLLGTKKMPRDLPEYMRFGDESEAIAYVAENGGAWAASRGAIEWLANASPAPKGRRRGRDE